MLKFSADLKVNRPVDKVFAWLTDTNNQAKFDKSSLAMELLTPGPWKSGSQFRELRDLGGRKTEVFSEIAELETNKRFVIRSKTGPGWLGTWMFEPDDILTSVWCETTQSVIEEQIVGFLSFGQCVGWWL